MSNKVFFKIVCFVLLFNCSNHNSDDSNGDTPVIIIDNTEAPLPKIELNLRVHIMRDIIMEHPTGLIMDSWVSSTAIIETILPEVNAIWEQADIVWKLESVIEEEVVKGDNYDEALRFIVNSERNLEGQSDPDRLPFLYSLMQPQYRSTSDQLGKNLFHIYLFPFIGNTSQGNAMSEFNYHSVIGLWTNKHNNGGVPEKALLTEHQSSFNRGSLSRTISHEIGHVLNLRHNECNYSCLMGGNNSDGYLLTENQILKARIEAAIRSIN